MDEGANRHRTSSRGFEITRISDESLQQLRDFMQSATICE